MNYGYSLMNMTFGGKTGQIKNISHQVEMLTHPTIPN